MQTHFRAPTGARCGARASAFRRRNTPLHDAADYGRANVVAALLAHGADVHSKDNFVCGGRSLFWVTAGVRCAAVDRDKIDAMQIGMHAHARIHTDALPYINKACADARTHARERTNTHSYTRRQARAAVRERERPQAHSAPSCR
jgi:hypothetical protein